jgi:hypothetical protein
MHEACITDDVLWRATRRADNHQSKREYHWRRGPVRGSTRLAEGSNRWLCGGFARGITRRMDLKLSDQKHIENAEAFIGLMNHDGPTRLGSREKLSVVNAK